jgi:hypothetical protein
MMGVSVRITAAALLPSSALAYACLWALAAAMVSSCGGHGRASRIRFSGVWAARREDCRWAPYGVTAELGEQLDAARDVATGGTLFGNPLSAWPRRRR